VRKPRLSKEAYRKRFFEVFSPYAKTQPIEDLARKLQKTESTIRKWIAGTMCPSWGGLKQLCVDLEWDFQELFSPLLNLDRVFFKRHFTFDDINRHALIAWERKDFSLVNHYVSVAGSMLLNHILQKCVPCSMTIDKHVKPVIVFEDARINSTFIQLYLDSKKGIHGCWDYLPQLKAAMAEKSQAAGLTQAQNGTFYLLTDAGVTELINDVIEAKNSK
jgi:hypothetical protein